MSRGTAIVGFRFALLAAVAAFIAACAGEPERLVPKSGAVPAGVDLSGPWRISSRSSMPSVERIARGGAGG